MNCPVCSKPSIVKDVRVGKKENKTRKRVCEKGHSFRSYELSEERYQELLDYERVLIKIQTVMKTYDE